MLTCFSTNEIINMLTVLSTIHLESCEVFGDILSSGKNKLFLKTRIHEIHTEEIPHEVL